MDFEVAGRHGLVNRRRQNGAKLGSGALSVQLTPGGSGQGIEVPRLCRSHAPPRSRTDSGRGASPKLPSFPTRSQLSRCSTCTESAEEPKEAAAGGGPPSRDPPPAVPP